MPEQPSPIADTRKPCPNCRYFIAATSVNDLLIADRLSWSHFRRRARAASPHCNALGVRLCHVGPGAGGLLDCPKPTEETENCHGNAQPPRPCCRRDPATGGRL